MMMSGAPTPQHLRPSECAPVVVGFLQGTVPIEIMLKPKDPISSQ